ncbi:MAG: ELWxxDGT repeat protein, partial [Thermoanaerobaculia bacterium]
MIRFSALLFALFTTCVSFAQSPYLVKDINTRTGGRSSSSNPSGFVADGGAVYFAAADHTGGTPVLWKVANGQLVKLENSQWHPLQPRNILPKGDGTCFFTAKNGSSPGGTGFELWRTDGTPEGTILLKDINPGSGQSAPENFLLKQGLLYFTADHPTYGRDIWVSDGTAAGTRLLKDFPLSSTIFPVGVVGNQVAILTGSALWLTDGTEAGTTMVKQWTYTWRSAHVVGSKIFVVANDGISGDELWVSDGTTAGTQRVTDFVQTSGPPFGDSQSTLIPLPNGVLFHADNGAGQAGLWFSDGTIAGTILVLNTPPPWMHSVVAGIAYFNTDVDLYRTNGTIAGTYRIDKAASRMPLPAFGAAYYVIANDNGTSAMRRTDGTIAGTSTAIPFPFDQDVYSMTATGGKLYFSFYTSLYGAEPFVSHDGASIEMLVNLAHDQMPSSSPRLMTGTAAGVFFFTTDGYLNAWFSDGTEGGTIPLGLPVPSNVRTSLSRVGSSVFIQVSNSWWKSDGTVAGTTPISFFPPDSTEVILNQFAASDRFYLATGTGIYVSDGTTTTQILPGGTYGFAAPDHFVEYAGRVYLQTYDSLWETRGPIETTRLISRRPGEFAGGAFYNSQQVDPVTGKRVLIRFDPAGAAVTLGTFSSPRSFEAAGRYVYFEDWSFETSTLWRTDGTAGGTIQLAQLSKAEPTLLVASGPYLYFWGFDSTHGGELWRTDGTLSGTVLVKDIAPGSSSSQPESLVRSLTDVRGNLWFTATDGLYYNELWRTDGTEAGTVKVANFGPTQLTVAGSHLFFAANDTATGEEPWAVELDGSALSIADTRVAEGNIGTTAMRFTVTREGDLSQSASATYPTESGSADETDYVAASGTVSFAVGQIGRASCR